LIVLSFAAPPSVGVDGRKNQRKKAFGQSAPQAKRGYPLLGKARLGSMALDFRPLGCYY
jgi:hypothetical protein